MPALESCEAELDQLVHLPLAVDNKSAPTEPETTRPTEGPLRHASLALGEKFTVESIVNGAMSPQRSPRSRSGSSKSGGTVALTLVMRSTRETTDFVASVLIWALKRDPSSHPASTAWQRNLEVFRGDESLWSPSFRRLQEPLRKELFESVRDERCATRHQNVRQFTFEELKLVEECTADLRVEIQELAARDTPPGAPPSLQFLDNLAQELTSLLDKIQVPPPPTALRPTFCDIHAFCGPCCRITQPSVT